MAASSIQNLDRRQQTERIRSFSDFSRLGMEAWNDFTRHNAYRFAAALAFYTVISLSPLVLIVVSALGLLFGQDAAQQQFVGQIEQLVGHEGAQAVKLVLENAREQSSGIIAMVLGLVAFIMGYIAVFFELQAGLNTMWGLSPGPNLGIWATLRKFLVSFGMLAVFGFLLLVSLFVSSVLSALNEYLAAWQPNLVVLWHVLNVALSFAVALLLFAVIYKYIPDVRIAWRDVWVGASITAVLFMIGKVLIGIYLGRSGVASSYGAAGSVVVILLWVYYSSLILFFGAELTQVYANHFGSKIRASTNQ